MNWKKYLSIIGISIFIYILLKLDLHNVFQEIIHADIFFILLSIFFVLILFFIQTLKWFVIAVKQNIKIPFMEAFKINLISNFYGFITPSKLGIITRVEYLKKYTDIGKGLCNFTIDKILDTASLFFTAIIFSFVFKEKLSFIPINLFIILFLVITFLTVIFIDKERSKIILGFFYKKFISKDKQDKAKGIFDSFYDNIPKKRYFILFFFLNLINWMIIYLIIYFIGLSVGINLSIWVFLAILPIGTLVSLLPISLNGLGTREATLISLFSLFGISATKVFSMSIINFFIAGIIPSLIASFLIFRDKNK